ncbi:MAG TPA: hypothetical protein VHX14_10450 [Thermoanaerobaculia bacterium]|jgi:hypothetical protein|nr:hypothetical protein [Thermoanaerobaculia bacterium]
MKSIAETRSNAISVQYALPMLLAVNTFALLAINQLGGIPDWIKSAAALFLSF